jgi:hypothetical protein
MTTLHETLWPKGEAYQTAPRVPELHPVCVCGARHLTPIPSCRRDNTMKDGDHGHTD